MLTRIGALIAQGGDARKQALKEICEAFVKAEGDRAKAAELLGVSNYRSVYYWLAAIPEGWDELDKALAAAGIKRHAGPPRKRDKVLAAVREAGGKLRAAATALGMKQPELVEEIHRLGLRDEVNKVLVAAGKPQIPARAA